MDLAVLTVAVARHDGLVDDGDERVEDDGSPMSSAALGSQNGMSTPALGSILLASTDPDRLRGWYQRAFDATPNPDGFLVFGGVAMLVDRRDDVADSCVEPGRVILNLHVDDARAAVAHLDGLGVTWVAELEFRGDAWFATLLDPDGNCLQIIELTGGYWAARGRPSVLARLGPLTRPGPGAGPALLCRRTRARADRGAARWLALRGCGGFVLPVRSDGSALGEHSLLAFELDQLDETVRELRQGRVCFEAVDLPGLRTIDGIAEVDGNYPSTGASGEQAAWFRDSEDNLLGIGQSVRP